MEKHVHVDKWALGVVEHLRGIETTEKMADKIDILLYYLDASGLTDRAKKAQRLDLGNSGRRQAPPSGKNVDAAPPGGGVIVVELPGEPRGKGRPRSRIAGSKVGGQQFVAVYTDAKTRAYEKALAWAGKAAMGPRKPLLGPLAVTVEAVFGVPRSWSRPKRDSALAGVLRPTGAPDVDNVLKVIDGLHGICLRERQPGRRGQDNEALWGRTDASGRDRADRVATHRRQPPLRGQRGLRGRPLDDPRNSSYACRALSFRKDSQTDERNDRRAALRGRFSVARQGGSNCR